MEPAEKQHISYESRVPADLKKEYMCPSCAMYTRFSLSGAEQRGACLYICRRVSSATTNKARPSGHVCFVRTQEEYISTFSWLQRDLRKFD